MSVRYSIAQRSTALNTLFAGFACAVTLALTAGPALAETTKMERVTVRGRVIEAPVRYDVHANCAGIDNQIEELLGGFAARWQPVGSVQVQFVMENGRIDGVEAEGTRSVMSREVRHATYRLNCGSQTASGPQIYRFNVAFVAPTAAGKSALAVQEITPAMRVASLDR